MNNLYLKFSQLIAMIAGTDATLPSDKVTLIARGVILAALFVVVFAIWYLYFTKPAPELRRMFWWSAGIFTLVVIGKYALYHFYKSYIPNHLIFYALPSPKAAGVGWFILPLIIFATFSFYREKMMGWPTGKFLASLWITFVSFALSVAATRDGLYSIYERFTHIFGEYTGNLPMVKSVGDFLHNFYIYHFSSLSHTVTHPPGFTLLLYFFQKIFQVDYLSLSVAVVMFGALSIIPIYYFFKEFVSEEVVRRGLTLYIFFPSVVLMGATTMDFTFVVMVWLAIALLYYGWRQTAALAFAGGLAAAGALFMNFLFLLLAPFFGWLVWYSWRASANCRRTLIGVGCSLAGFILFFLVIQHWSGYSIIDNFFVARLAAQSVVPSNFESVGKFLIYMFVSLAEFAFYLGIPYLYLFFTDLRGSWRKSALWFKVGVANVAFFLIIGIFQGETGRLWLFLTPFFVLGNMSLLSNDRKREYSAFLALTAFQIMLTQSLFYADW